MKTTYVDAVQVRPLPGCERVPVQQVEISRVYADVVDGSITGNPPSDASAGDYCVVGVCSWQSQPTNVPSGLSEITSTNYGPNDGYLTVFGGTLALSGAGTSFTFNGVTYPSQMTACFHGPQAVDSFTANPSTTGSDSISVLKPTATANEPYLLMGCNDTANFVNPSDLSEVYDGFAGWYMLLSYKIIPAAGATPNAEMLTD